MQKLVLVSILLTTFAVPLATEGTPAPGLALRRLVWWMLAGTAAYALAVVFVFPMLL